MRAFSGRNKPSAKPGPRAGHAVGLAGLPFPVFILWVLALAGFAYQWMTHHEIELGYRSLAAVADLKQKQIAERMALIKRDAEIMTSQGLLAYGVEQWIKDDRPDNETAARINKRLGVFQKAYNLKSMLLLDHQGRKVMVSGMDHPPPAWPDVQQALRSHAVRITQAHSAEGGKPGVAYIDVVAPLLVDRQGQLHQVGALAYHVDLAAFLFPVVQSWSMSKLAEETLLVSRQGDQAVFLNEPLHGEDEAPKFRVDLAGGIPSIHAKRDDAGQVEGLDHRGIPVLLNVRPIPGIDWLMVGMQDLDGIHRPARRTGWIAACLIAAFGLVFWLWHARRLTGYALAATQAELNAARLEERFASLLSQANDIILLMTEHGVILDANERAFEVYGYSRSEMIGMDALKLRLTGEQGPSDQVVDEFWRHLGERPYETVHRRADGSPLLLEANIRTIDSEGEKYRQAILRDIGERKLAERRHRRLSDFYIALSQTNQSIVRIGAAEELFREICRIAVEYTHVKLAFIVRPDAQTGVMQPLACAGPNAGCLEKARITVNEWEPEGRGNVGTCFRTLAPIIIQDVETDPRMLPWRELWKSYGMASGVVFPITQEGQAYGVLGLYADESHCWDEALFNLIKEMAGDISFALDNLAKESRRRQIADALRESEMRHRLLFEHMRSGFALHEIVTDAAGAPLDYVFLAVNPAYESMAGLDAQAIVGKRATETHPAIGGATADSISLYGAIALSGEARCFERFDEGLERWFDIAAYQPAPRQFAVLVNDITERKQAERKLLLAASVFASTQEGILITDQDANILEVNPAFTRLTGYAREEVLGKNPHILKSDRHDAEFYSDLWRALRENGLWRGEIWNRRKDGSLYLEWLTISAVTDKAGEPTHYIGAFFDITLVKQQERRLEYLAYFDPLTGVPNRVLLADRMRQAIAHARRQECLFAVGYLDLDAFKPINDQFGHAVGDGLLVEVAQRIRGALREGDTVARLGGDEFVVLLLDLERTEECFSTLRRLLNKIAEPLTVQDHRLAITASIGASLFPLDDADPDTLLRHADQAMYQAKQAGKNRFHLYDHAADSHARARLEKLARIGEALERREFVLFYQPKIDLRSGRVIGAEALIRWQHPELGLVPPMDFLPLIESHVLVQQVDHWVMEEALRQMAEWAGLGLDLSVSVNVTAQSLQAADFCQDIATLLARFPGIDPCRYQLEILESAALDDIEYISQVMRACQDMGLRFALDDFGTGYSSLIYLKHLPAEVLKIDQSFVRDMLEDAEDLAIVEGVIGLARAFRRQVVAEGVETIAHGAHLLRLGCDIAQGYGIARPMPAAKIPGWIKEWKPLEACKRRKEDAA